MMPTDELNQWMEENVVMAADIEEGFVHNVAITFARIRQHAPLRLCCDDPLNSRSSQHPDAARCSIILFAFADDCHCYTHSHTGANAMVSLFATQAILQSWDTNLPGGSKGSSNSPISPVSTFTQPSSSSSSPHPALDLRVDAGRCGS